MPNCGYSETRRADRRISQRGIGLPSIEKPCRDDSRGAGGLNIVLKAILDEGEEVIVPSPLLYGIQIFTSKIAAVQIRWSKPIRLLPQPEGN